MLRKWLLSIALLGGMAGLAAAQPPFLPGQRLPQLPAQPIGLEGQWFMSGDPFQPCYVQANPDPRGPRLLFTNERGEQSWGDFIRGGSQVIVYDWGGGGLIGDLRRNAILWHNGTTWLR